MSMWFWVRRGILLICLTGPIVFGGPISYPLWFLYSGLLQGPNAIVGLADPAYYPDSSAAQAIYDGYFKYAQYSQTTIHASKAYWAVEDGMHLMDFQNYEVIDTNKIVFAPRRLQPVDTLFTKSLTAVLLMNKSNTLPDSFKQMVRVDYRPKWIDEIPRSNLYFFSVGMAPLYYYEKSSWQEAETRAIVELARSVEIRIRALQKTDFESQIILDESLAVTLKNIAVVSRWYDKKDQFFYVLVRMPVYFN